MAADPMFQLEHTVEDKEKQTDDAPRLDLLQVPRPPLINTCIIYISSFSEIAS